MKYLFSFLLLSNSLIFINGQDFSIIPSLNKIIPEEKIFGKVKCIEVKEFNNDSYNSLYLELWHIQYFNEFNYIYKEINLKEDSSIRSICYYKYNNKNQIVQLNCVDVKGDIFLTEKNEFDSKGNIIEHLEISDNEITAKHIYKYDSLNNEIYSCTIYARDNKNETYVKYIDSFNREIIDISNGDTTKIKIYENDTIHKLVRFENDLPIQTTINYFNKNKENTKLLIISGNDTSMTLFTNRRIKDKLIKEAKRYSNGKMDYYNYSEYDKMGNLLNGYSIDDDNKKRFVKSYKYKYDIKGNIIYKNISLIDYN